MEARCPNCGKDIHLVGARELKEDYGIGPNSVQHAREKGKFPEPWLSFANRNIWIREVIDSYVTERSQRQVETTVRDLLKALDHLSGEAREEAKKQIASAGLAPTPRRRK